MLSDQISHCPSSHIQTNVNWYLVAHLQIRTDVVLFIEMLGSERIRLIDSYTSPQLEYRDR